MTTNKWTKCITVLWSADCWFRAKDIARSAGCTVENARQVLNDLVRKGKAKRARFGPSYRYHRDFVGDTP